MRESFIFYRSFYESIKQLDEQSQYHIYKAIVEHEFEEKKHDLEGIEKAIFILIEPQLNANKKRYENGCKGGRPKNQKITKIKPKNNQNKTKTKPNNNENVNVNENENNNNNVNVNKKYYDDEKLNKTFLEFLQLRKKLKAVNSDRAITLLINQLSNYDDETKLQMIEQSILNSWKSVYEIKKKNMTYADRMDELFEEL